MIGASSGDDLSDLDEIVRHVHQMHANLEAIEAEMGPMASGLTLVACAHARAGVDALDKLRRELVWKIWDEGLQ